MSWFEALESLLHCLLGCGWAGEAITTRLPADRCPSPHAPSLSAPAALPAD